MIVINGSLLKKKEKNPKITDEVKYTLEIYYFNFIEDKVAL